MAISFIGSDANNGTGTTVTVSKPTNTASGDVLIACVHATTAGGTAPGAFSWPAGWTVMQARAGSNSSTNSARREFAWMEYTSGTSWTFTASPLTDGSWSMSVGAYRGCGTPITPEIATASSATSSGTGDIASGDITSPGGDAWLIGMSHGFHATASTTPVIVTAASTDMSTTTTMTSRSQSANTTAIWRSLTHIFDSDAAVGAGTVDTIIDPSTSMRFRGAFAGILTVAAGASAPNSCGILIG